MRSPMKMTRLRSKAVKQSIISPPDVRTATFTGGSPSFSALGFILGDDASSAFSGATEDIAKREAWLETSPSCLRSDADAARVAAARREDVARFAAGRRSARAIAHGAEHIVCAIVRGESSSALEAVTGRAWESEP